MRTIAPTRAMLNLSFIKDSSSQISKLVSEDSAHYMYNVNCQLRLTLLISLNLHHEVVLGHPTVHEELVQPESAVLLHGIQQFPGLETDGLEGRPAEVAPVGELGEAADGAAGVRAPVRGEQARQAEQAE